MPFANLPTYEKDAFFSLLDEYFASRPELLTRVGGSSEIPATERTETQPLPQLSPAAAAAIATTAQRALANPATSRALAGGFQRASSSLSGNTASATTTPNAMNADHAAAVATTAQRALANPAASRALAAGFQRASSSLAGTGNTASAAAAPNAPNADHAASSPAVSVGRVAAAAQAFSGAPSATPSPPRRGNPLAPAPAVQRADLGGLAPQKKFGDVDVSSAGAMFRSLRGSTAAKNAPPPPVQTPSAFTAKKIGGGFAPPPVRRVPASSSPAHVPEPEPEPEPQQDFQPEREGEEEATGQWAEALYDYTSEEAGDLHLRVGERVLVTDQTSSDWWTGEIDSRSGLFPASYVKLL
ncbi:hypothetical protein BJV78DRAFT_1283134 [Lactifluus subvellereus]|nr:hypothetical protein BJV78DRAFT_1283134 [Lactifluus subvellereus]